MGFFGWGGRGWRDGVECWVEGLEGVVGVGVEGDSVGEFVRCF